MRTAITAANVKKAKGSFDGPSRSYTIDANDQLRSAAEYRAIVVAYRNGAPLYLSDVADVIEDAENVRLAAWMNEVPAIIVNIQRQPGANVIEVVDRIKRALPQLTASLPAAVDVAVLTDRTVTIRASVRDVQFELAARDRAGGDGDLPLPAQRRRPRSSPASRCRCRSSAPSASCTSPGSRSTT